MTFDEIRSKVEEYLATSLLLDLTSDRIDVDTDLLSNDLIDSLGFVELITYIESEFGIELSNEDLKPESISSIRKIVSLAMRDS